MRSKQLAFDGQEFKKPKDWFGGSALKSHPKRKRPLDRKLPVHLVLRAKKSVLKIPANEVFINKTVTSAARRYGIRIYEFANVGNHIHLMIRVSKPELWRRFIREITGQISQYAQKLGARDKGEGFWLYRPFTRIVRGWKRAYRVVKDYILLNRLESEGFIDREVIRSVADFRQFTESTA